jgi:hypothetical protein
MTAAVAATTVSYIVVHSCSCSSTNSARTLLAFHQAAVMFDHTALLLSCHSCQQQHYNYIISFSVGWALLLAASWCCLWMT